MGYSLIDNPYLADWLWDYNEIFVATYAVDSARCTAGKNNGREQSHWILGTNNLTMILFTGWLQVTAQALCTRSVKGCLAVYWCSHSFSKGKPHFDKVSQKGMVWAWDVQHFGVRVQVVKGRSFSVGIWLRLGKLSNIIG